MRLGVLEEQEVVLAVVPDFLIRPHQAPSDAPCAAKMAILGRLAEGLHHINLVSKEAAHHSLEKMVE